MMPLLNFIPKRFYRSIERSDHVSVNFCWVGSSTSCTAENRPFAQHLRNVLLTSNSIQLSAQCSLFSANEIELFRLFEFGFRFAYNICSRRAPLVRCDKRYMCTQDTTMHGHTAPSAHMWQNRIHTHVGL